MRVFGLLACDWLFKQFSCSNDTELPQVQEMVNEFIDVGGRHVCTVWPTKTCTSNTTRGSGGAPLISRHAKAFKHIYIYYTEIKKNIIETF